ASWPPPGVEHSSYTPRCSHSTIAHRVRSGACLPPQADSSTHALRFRESKRHARYLGAPHLLSPSRECHLVGARVQRQLRLLRGSTTRPRRLLCSGVSQSERHPLMCMSVLRKWTPDCRLCQGFSTV